MTRGIAIRRNAPLSNAALNALFEAAWPDHETRDFQRVLERSLATVAAYAREELVGFVNVAWDGGVHGFILDTTVHPSKQRRGIALALLEEAQRAAGDAGLEWLHVDFEPELEPLYRHAGYQGTAAGLLRVSSTGA